MRYWDCEHDDECGTVLEGRSIVTCPTCWEEVKAADEAARQSDNVIDLPGQAVTVRPI